MTAIERITLYKRSYSDDEILSMLRPYVAEWFRSTYGSFTEPQRQAIPLVKQGKSVLITSPTGTGKTLAAFLGVIDEILFLMENRWEEKGILAVYVSPLRALNNDIRRNLEEPLRGIEEKAREMGLEPPRVKVAVRTSDTTPYEKQKMVKDPPHILITTPESLAAALAAPKFRERLSTVKWVVLDEIHELASNKRGAHLMVSVERLEELVREAGGKPLRRIGLSATIAPLDVVANFLGGFDDEGRPREVHIVDARFAKPIDIKVITPDVDLLRDPPDKINEAIYRKIAELVKQHRTTLIFTNTRSATERVVHKLKQILVKEGIASEDQIEAHHSSLSRNLRLDVEERLKRGELKVVVSSTSLELGIDIGYIDLVILLSSPKSVSRLLQRVGRAGHRIRDVSKGRLIVVDRDDLVECSVLADCAMKKFIDRVRIPMKPLDVLAQHIVGMSIEKKWRLEDAYRVVKRAYNFKDLSFEEFMSVVRFLAGKHGLEGEGVYSKIWLDEEEGLFGRKKSARMIYLLNVGVIPDETKIRVYTRDGKYVGDLEEEFVEILVPGDVFVLGGRTYRFLKSEGLRVIVERADDARPTVPSWFSEMLPLSFDSALKVGEFRRVFSALASSNPRAAVEKLVKEYYLEERAAATIVEYILEQLGYIGVVPSDKLVLIEYFPYEDGWGIVFHTLFGRRVNDALSRAYAVALSRRIGLPVRVAVTDNGFMLTVSEAGKPDASLLEKLIRDVTPENIRGILEEAISRTELMKRRFKHVAARMFIVLRRYKGKEVSPERLQLNSQKLLEVFLEEMKDSPPIRETFREILEDYMDIGAAGKVLEWIRKGEIEIVIKGPLPYPSPMAHSIVVRGYSDVVLMEDRRKMLMILREKVLEYIRKGRAAPTWVGGDGKGRLLKEEQ
ncbi:putative ATP-dependent helicase [Aeropyrum pernix K1]|uniref:ATP-dependent helicase n=1 Tax=Aeropyrum pernix (strain ATCC 700893 / DSM 11879 / JCM 9820 / NBRC 100138 / K1) TaxID=272557 RepID=Q9Y9Z5_AERPE|nr:ATP-dependent helicase [Aeropyrum pernix]BAA81155.2 putative ATP-dependent helicase [Aeropyrum pernix K1]